ncbi:MAG: transposase [Saprospiraceae bacterium]|nr:transposase [Saprospiraceae bacterium]
MDYGYIKVTHWLRKRRGYLINKKKVYRLMKDHKLLNSNRLIQRQPRLWVAGTSSPTR